MVPAPRYTPMVFRAGFDVGKGCGWCGCVVYVVTTKPTKQNNDANGSCTMKSVCFELVGEVVIDGFVPLVFTVDGVWGYWGFWAPFESHQK